MNRGVPPLVGFAGRRLLRGVVTIWFAVTVTFLLLRLLPGDPALAVASENMTPEIRAQLLHDYGLDQPLWVQYGKYIWQLLHGNLGISFAQQQPVSTVLAQQLPWTLLLMATSMVLTLVLGIPLGVAAARRQGGLVDRGAQMFSVAAGSLFVPSAGIGLLWLFGLTLHWLPIGGAYADDAYGWTWYLSIAEHLILPALSLMLVSIGAYVLTLRSTLIGALQDDYADLARAKGAPERSVVWKHALRNALLPITTLAGLQLGFLVGGAVLTETIFAYPGVARGIYTAVTQQDYPLLQGAFVVLAISVVVANFLTDMAYGLLDPRVRMTTA
jgi:peptide/nickel transport system permease protein